MNNAITGREARQALHLEPNELRCDYGHMIIHDNDQCILVGHPDNPSGAALTRFATSYYRCDGCGALVRIMATTQLEQTDLHYCPACVRERNYHLCSSCGCAIGMADPLRLNNGLIVCNSCWTRRHTCVECGSMCNEEDLTWTNGGHVCHSCLAANYAQCDECGKWFHLEDLTTVHGYSVCYRCLPVSYAQCDDCGGLFRREDLITTDRGSVCYGCLPAGYTECDDCGVWFHIEDLTTVNGNSVCHRCLPANYTQCDECGEYVRHDEIETYNGRNYCADCYDNNVVLDDYAHTHAHTYHRRDGEHTKLYYGLEIETELDGADPATCRRHMRDLYADIECKFDGSLDDGAEYAWQPMTLAYLRDHADTLREALDGLSNEGCTSHDTTTCGMHIHASRAGLWPDDPDDEERISEITANIMLIMGRYELSHLRHIARRDCNNWARSVHTKERITTDKTEMIKTVLDESKRRNRYHALNVTRTDTIEFRFFRGTLNADTVLASVELCDALITYAREHTHLNIAAMCWEDLLDADKYPHLQAYNDRIEEKYQPDMVQTIYI